MIRRWYSTTFNPRIDVSSYLYRFSIYSLSEGDDLLTNNYTAEGHRIVVDEPKAVGGLGRAPNPIELFLASLASCFVVTLKLHARRLGVPVGDVKVVVEGVFDVRGFIVPEKFKSGFNELSLVAEVLSNGKCVELKKLIDKVLTSWVVGSTVSRALPINVKLRIKCVSDDGVVDVLTLERVIRE